MTRRWVKEELKKNPVQDFLVKLIKYVREHKQNFIIGVIVAVALGIGTFLIIRARILENRYAAQAFSSAQQSYSQFNYDAVIQKCDEIEEKYGNAEIMDQVFYLKGMAYYDKEDYETSTRILARAAEEYPESEIISEIRIALASGYEQNDFLKKALTQYERVEEDSYLKPEALSGEARIYELMDQEERAIEVYNNLQSSYSNTYWARTASERLSALGVEEEETGEFQPDIELE